MRIASWNINSVRARLHRIEPWIERHAPDVLLLQETKCADGAFPHGSFAQLGYEVAASGGTGRHSGYNGVAILSRVGLAAVTAGLPGAPQEALRAAAESDWDPAWVDEPRVLTARCGGVRVTTVYAPNGRAVDHAHYRYKLAWIAALGAWMGRPGRATALVAGDLNVAPADIDVWNPKGWRGRTHVSPAERERIAAIFAQGWRDAWETAPSQVRGAAPPRGDTPGATADGDASADGRLRACATTADGLAAPVRYTWWNYRPGCFTKDQGLRVDLAFATPALARRLQAAWVDRAERGRERPSDHAPLVFDLEDHP